MTAILRSGPFGWLPADEPVAVRCGYDNLTRSVVGIFGRRADRPTRSKLSVQAINIIDFQIAEPVMRTKRARVDVGRATAQYNPNAAPRPIANRLHSPNRYETQESRGNTKRSYRRQGPRARMPTGPFLLMARHRRQTGRGFSDPRARRSAFFL
jgi:hypothetical protein